MLEFGRNKDFWESLRNGEKSDFLKKIYEENYIGEDIPQLRYNVRMLHDRVGTRREFETPYFRRRRFLDACALLSAIYPENKEYYDKMQDLIFAICEEWSWAVPAHTFDVGIDGNTQIDLFSAETALMLAEIYYIHGDRLEPIIRSCIERELDRRIFTSFESKHFWFEECTHNWAPICAGNVACAMLYMDPERFERNRERLFLPMNNFVAAQPSDGVCLEGVNYWSYGFGTYVMIADILYKYSDGKYDFFADPKVKKIAQYPSHAFMRGDISVSNSDGHTDDKVDAHLYGFLKERFGEEISPLPKTAYTYWPGCIAWLNMSRTLIYPDARLLSDGELRSVDLPDAGQVMIHEDKYSLFVKGGHNDEPHNHNDLGSFIISTDNGPIFCDLGAGLYVFGYFIPETRYDYFCNCSRGHSLPIINGQYQKPGKERRAEISHEGNLITAEFSSAYDIAGVSSVKRSFLHSADSIVMKDEFVGEVKSVTERFISLKEPVSHDGYVEISGVRLYYDKDKCTVKITEDKESFINHRCAVNPPVPTPVFIVDFELSELDGAEFKFVF